MTHEATNAAGNGERIRSLVEMARGEIYGDVRLARQLLDEALALATDTGDATQRARVLSLRGWLRARSGDEGAARDAREALALLEGTDEVEALAQCHLALGILNAMVGRYEDAFEPLRRVRLLAVAEGLAELDVVALNSLGLTLSDLGDNDEADTILRTAVQRAEAAGAGAIRSLAEANLALNNVRRVHAARTRTLPLDEDAVLDEALALVEGVKAYMLPRGDMLGLAAALDNEAQIFNARAEPTRALEAIDRALAIYRPAGDHSGEVYALCSRAEAYVLLGATAPAEDAAREALALAVRRNLRLASAKAYAALAAAAEAAGRLREALDAYKCLDALRDDAVRQRDINRARLALTRMDADRARAEAARERARASELELANEDLRAAAAALARASREDSLTGLYNRRALADDLTERFARAPESRAFVVALLDIDDFKTINDRLSHPVGDAVLREVATLLRAGLRSGDLAARFGGDEIMLVLDGLDAVHAHVTLDRMRTRIADYPWPRLSPGLRVTVSIGWSDAADAADGPAAIAAADRHLYEAKRAGRNRVAP